MDFATISEIITTLGFPIACCIALGAFIWKIYKRSEQREDTLMNEIAETRLVNAQAIETLTKYADNFEALKADVEQIKTDISIFAHTTE